MEKIRNLSLRKSIILYMIISLLVSFFSSYFIIRTATFTQQQIWQKYIDEEEYTEAINNEGADYEVSIARPSRYVMSDMDWRISEGCDFLETYSVLFLAIIGSFVAVGLFYRNKLRKPIQELDEASKMIAMNELEFHVTYKNQDELGQLCAEFERMRAQLEENNRIMWRMVEDEKFLRASIAHDIRSPLAILKGYQEMLLEFVPEETLDKDRMLEMLSEGMKQIERMNLFIETMREMTSLEARELHFTITDAITLKEEIEKEVKMTGKATRIECEVFVDTKRQSFAIDKEVVLEVAENLLSNAFRYARQKIEVRLSSTDNELVIVVQDDGIGFQEKPEMITKAFYHSNPQDDLHHFGMGMYICRVYCERHGGKLLVGSSKNGGASVQATFQLNK